MNGTICELIDNAIEIWINNKMKKELGINLGLNKEQQNIAIDDMQAALKKRICIL